MGRSCSDDNRACDEGFGVVNCRLGSAILLITHVYESERVTQSVKNEEKVGSKRVGYVLPLVGLTESCLAR